MSYAASLTHEELEIYTLTRILGGSSKVKELLKIMHDKNISIGNLLEYLKSIEYNVPSPLETKIEDLERRVAMVEEELGVEALQPTPPQLPAVKEWSNQELENYLNRCRKRRKFTLYYYKVLTEVDGKIGRRELIEKVAKLSRKEFTGFSLAGVQAGITMSITKHDYERLDWKDKNARQFSLNTKYREKMRSYFRALKEAAS